jgi:TolB protein
MTMQRVHPERPPLPVAGVVVVAVLCGAPYLAAQKAPPPPAEALPSDVEVVLDRDASLRLNLAVPRSGRPPEAGPEFLDAINEVEQTLREDLAFTQLFDVQGPEVLSTVRLTGDRQQDLEQYRAYGNEVALLTEFKISGEELILEGRVYDLARGQFILGKRFNGGIDLARRFAHAMSDEVVLYFTGRRGIAMTAIAFVSDRESRESKEIFLMDYDGHAQRRITGHISTSLSPVWARDGSGLVYLSFFEGRPGVYWADLVTGRKTAIIAEEQPAYSPSLCPDGETLLFARRTSNMEVFAVPRSGGSPRQLTRSSRIDTNPECSPDGARVAFTSSRSGTPQIYVMGVDGTDLRRVTFEGRYNEGASWHPDGSRLVYSRRADRGDRHDIAVIDLVTGQDQLLTTGPASHENPSFSPNGEWIAFDSRRPGGRRHIYIMSQDGRYTRQVTTRGNNSHPSWSGYFD